MKNLVDGFVDYVRKQGVVGLAVGLALGIQASNVVSVLVNQFVNPLVGLILNGTDLSAIRSTVERNGDVLVFGWGNILQAVITLVATALIIYYVIDKTGLSKLDKK